MAELAVENEAECESGDTPEVYYRRRECSSQSLSGVVLGIVLHHVGNVIATAALSSETTWRKTSVCHT